MTISGLPSVLIVDDDNDIRAGLHHMLDEIEEVEIVEAADGQAALDAMTTTRFDLVFLDINMPKIGGDQVVAALDRDATLNRPGFIVVMSAQSNLNAMKSSSESAGVDRLLPKPFRYEDLQSIVADALMPDCLGDLGFYF